MFESDYEIECDNDCGPGPPPFFDLPPPPRPDFLHDLEKCTESSLSDYEMCEAIPILDASYHSSPSLQTSAMILLCSVLLLIIIFVSSILVWKHKRKVQNFLPCKTPTRGPLDPSVMPVGHAAAYEDPDIHMGHHRPLVMRQHPLNVEMLHTKAIHYPSGFPMPHSPPLFICSSPGPDPYRSNDNVYEELEHRNNRFSDCDRQLHSDEDFAEDELSLPGDRSLNKSSSENTTVATIYQERGVGPTSSNVNENGTAYLERNRVERNSLLSSASSTANDVTRPNMRNSSSSNESNHHSTLNHLNNHSPSTNGAGSAGIFRFRTSRPNTCKSTKSSRQKTNNFSMDNLNSSADTTPADEVPSYGNGSGSSSSGNNNTGSSTASATNHNGDTISPSALNGEGDTNNNSNNCGRSNYFGAESEVERRNRINAQLSNPALNVATIFRDRNIRYHPARANANYYAPPQHVMASRSSNNGELNNRSRTNPRVDRRRNANANTPTNETNSNSINTINNTQEYLYHEPVYNENMVCDVYNGSNGGRNQALHQPYILPEFTTFRNFNNLSNPHQPLYNASAVGSDSGYSQNTQTSGRSLWGRRKRGNGNINNGTTIATPSALSTLARNETSDTYEGS